MVEVDPAKKRGGGGMALLKAGAAYVSGGASAALDAATGGASGAVEQLGKGISSKLSSGSGDAIKRRYLANKGSGFLE